MKPIITSVFASFICFTAQSQSISTSRVLPRLISSVHIANYQTGSCPDYFYVTDGDSITYSYSGNRGGDLNHQIKFDIATEYKYDTAKHIFLNTPDSKTYQTFDSRDNLIYNKSGLNCKRYYTYDDANRLLSYTSYLNSNYTNPLDSLWYGWEKYQYTYDANGNQTMKIFQMGSSANPGLWWNEQKTKSTFDKDNHLLNTLDQVGYYPTNQWLDAQRSSFLYLNGYHSSVQDVQKWDTVSGSWVNYSRITKNENGNALDSYKYFQYWQSSINNYGCGGNDSLIIYDDANRIKSVFGTSYYGNVLTGCSSASTRMHLYTYDGNGRLICDSIHGGYEVYSDFDGDRPQHTLYIHHGNPFNTYVKYNRYGQIIYQFSTSLERSDTIRNYYDYSQVIADSIKYQDSLNNIYTGSYNDTAIVGNYNLHIFPVPSNDHFTIDLRWDVARSYSLSVFTIDGKLMNQFAGPFEKHSTISFSTKDLPAGNYLIKINYDKGVIVRRLVVVN